VTIGRATAFVARTAILVPLLVGATGTKALGAGGKRAGVPKFDGVQEIVVRKRVMQVLKAHGYELAKSREMELGVANTGALLDSDDGFAKVAKEAALSVIVTGEIGKKRAKIAVHDGRDGATLGQAAFPGANPRKMAAEVARTFWSKLGGEIDRGRAPAGAKKVQKVVADAPDVELARETGMLCCASATVAAVFVPLRRSPHDFRGFRPRLDVVAPAARAAARAAANRGQPPDR